MVPRHRALVIYSALARKIDTVLPHDKRDWYYMVLYHDQRMGNI